MSVSFASRSCVVALFVMTAAPSVAGAADLPEAGAPPSSAPFAPASAPDWTVTVGGEFRLIPAWPGAPTTTFGYTGLPLISIRQAGTPPLFFGERDGFGFPIINLDQIKIGPAFTLIWQRIGSSYAQLNGLNDVNFALQAGGFIELWPVPWLRLRTELRQGIGGEKGVTGDAYLDAVVPFGQFRWSGGPRVTAQSSAAVSPYFSITAAEAAAANMTAGQPPLTPYNASGGLYSWGAGTKLEYFFNPTWEAHVFAEYQRLTGSVADSPLVTERGSPNQLILGVGATYSFNMQPLW